MGVPYIITSEILYKIIFQLKFLILQETSSGTFQYLIINNVHFFLRRKFLLLLNYSTTIHLLFICY